jgi:hypothetical protein
VKGEGAKEKEEKAAVRKRQPYRGSGKGHWPNRAMRTRLVPRAKKEDGKMPAVRNNRPPQTAAVRMAKNVAKAAVG